MKEIKRDFYLNRLISRSKIVLIKVITGMRRCGKSYLLFKLYYNYLYHSSIDCSFQPNSWQIVPGFSKYCCIQRQRQPCRIRIMDKRRRFKSGFRRTERTLRGNAAGIPHRVPCKLCISEPVQKRFASSSGVSSSVSVGTTIGRARARFSMTTCLWFPPNSPSLVQLIS